MAFAPILASLAAINSSTSLIQGGISAVQSGISMIGQLFTKVFNKLGEIAVRIFTKIKDFIGDKIMPALDPLIKVATTVFNGVMGVAKKFIDFIIDGFSKIPETFNNVRESITTNLGKIPEVFTSIKENIIEKLGNVKDFIFSIPERITDAIGRVGSRIGTFIQGIRNKLGGVGEFIGEQFAKVGDIIMWPFKQVWNIIKKIKDAIAGAVGGLIDKAKGIFGGGKKKAESAAASAMNTVAQAITNNFAITINLTSTVGTTREQAREIGELLQEEVARTLGGTTTKSRYA
tara:strand:+ start:331 stop:1197 length:867 start_codon:yes stop_codon:yes gene_type:complete